MGFVADAIGDVVGGVADAVGTVAEAAVDLAGDAIQAVADNPLLLAAAVASPFALSALAAETAGVGAIGFADAAAFETAMGLTPAIEGLSAYGGLAAGVDAAGMGLIGPSLMGAAGATPEAIAAAELSAGAGSGILGGGALSGGLSILPSETFLGSVASSAGGLMSDAFTFPSMTEATNFGSSILDATNSTLQTFDASQTAASTVMSNSPTITFNSNYLSSDLFSQAQNAASLVDSPGISFSNAISTATEGAITPNAPTSIFSSAWDSVKGVAQTISDVNSSAGKLMNTIGQTIAPNADPLVQKFITNTAVNTVANGGDLKSALENGMIGTAAGLAGSTVAGATADTFGKTASNMLGSAAANATGTALSGGDIGQSLLNAGIGAVGSGATSLTGSPLIGGAVKTAVGTGLNGGDIGQGLLNYGVNAGVGAGTSYLGNLLGANTSNPNSPLNMLGRYASSSLTGMLNGQPTIKRPTILASAPKSLTSSLLQTNKSPTLLQSGTNGASNSLTSGNNPPQKVDVSTLKPVADISSLIGKKTI